MEKKLLNKIKDIELVLNEKNNLLDIKENDY